MPVQYGHLFPNNGIFLMTRRTNSLFFIVEGDSMQPAYKDGDLIIAQQIRDIAIGDVIMFRERLNNLIVIHRVISEENQMFITKGDANSSPDPDPLTRDKALGKVWMRIPKIGHIFRAIQRRRTVT